MLDDWTPAESAASALGVTDRTLRNMAARGALERCYIDGRAYYRHGPEGAEGSGLSGRKPESGRLGASDSEGCASDLEGSESPSTAALATLLDATQARVVELARAHAAEVATLQARLGTAEAEAATLRAELAGEREAAELRVRLTAAEGEREAREARTLAEVAVRDAEAARAARERAEAEARALRARLDAEATRTAALAETLARVPWWAPWRRRRVLLDAVGRRPALPA